MTEHTGLLHKTSSTQGRRWSGFMEESMMEGMWASCWLQHTEECSFYVPLCPCWCSVLSADTKLAAHAENFMTESAITSWQSDKDDVIQRLTLRHRGNQQAVLSCLEEKLEDPPLTQHLYGVQRTVQDRAGPPNQFAESQQTAAWRSLMPTQRSGVSSAAGGDCDLLVQGVRVIKSSLVFFHHLITARMINFCMLRLTCLCLDLWEL